MTTYALRTLGAPVEYTTGSGYSVFIDGQPVFVIAGSLSVDKTIGKRSQAAFNLLTTTPTHFQQYQQVSIYDQNGVLTFSGYINNPKEQKPGFQPTLVHSIQCVDQHFLADKRRIAATYVNKTCGEIVQNIVANILSQEGVTVGMIFDGIPPDTTLYPSNSLYPGGNVGLVPSATFAYCKVSEALDALVTEASAAGVPYYWQIDEYKKLWFVPYTAVVNSNVVDGSNIDHTSNPPTVSRQNPTYRNTQYIIGGVAQTVQQVNVRVGDGNATTFTMDYDLAQAPTIRANTGSGYASKTAGIRGVDSGKDWYWQKGSPEITQDSSGTKLRGSPNNDLIETTYIGQYPTVVLAQSDAQIAYQAALDSTTGIIEEVETDNTLTSVASGLTKASALLTRYGVQGTLLTFSTLDAEYAPGQLITVDLPVYGLNTTQMLIESVSASDQHDGLNIWYAVNAVAGPYDQTWQDFWGTLLSQSQIANSINVGVSTSITLLKSWPGSLSLAATLTATVSSCPVPLNTLYPSSSLYPC